MLLPCLRILSICREDTIDEKTVNPVITPETIPRSPIEKFLAKKTEVLKFVIRRMTRKIHVYKKPLSREIFLK
jgi:hypothetical protein